MRFGVVGLVAMIATPWVVSAQGDSATAARDVATFRIVPGASRASYVVDEVFLEENNRLFTAVGTTPGVSGEIILHLMRPELSRLRQVVVDLRQLTSDSERRDRALRERFLESRRYPFARLDTAALLGLPRTFTPAQRFPFRLDGNLEVHGTTRRTSWSGEAMLSGDTLRGQATTRVAMSDFGIEVPRFLWLRVADSVKVEIFFVAMRHRAPPDIPAAHDPTLTYGDPR